MTEITEAALNDLARLAEAATPGPWVLQTGCSWRRIGTDWHDGNVLRPTNHHLGKHPDLAATQDTLEYIVAACNAVPALITALRESRAQMVRMREALEYIAGPHGTPYPAGSLEACIAVRKNVQNIARAALAMETPDV